MSIFLNIDLKLDIKVSVCLLFVLILPIYNSSLGVTLNEAHTLKKG